MKNLELLATECKQMLKEIGIPYHNPYQIAWDRSKRRWGCCHRERSMMTDDYSYKITITGRLRDDSIPDEAVKKVLLHELLHTCDDCWDHTGIWKKYAKQVHDRIGYDITRTDSEESLNVAGKIEHNYKYIITCDSCGAQWKRYKKSNLVAYTNLYKCHCGGKLHCKTMY